MRERKGKERKPNAPVRPLFALLLLVVFTYTVSIIVVIAGEMRQPAIAMEVSVHTDEESRHPSSDPNLLEALLGTSPAAVMLHTLAP